MPRSKSETCRRGHPQNAENSLDDKKGRRCRLCHNINQRLLYYRRVGKEPPLEVKQAAGLEPPDGFRFCKSRHLVPIGDKKCRECHREIDRRSYYKRVNPYKRCRRGHLLIPNETAYVRTSGQLTCIACTRIRNAMRPRKPKAGRTHCKHGHELTPENTRVIYYQRTASVERRCITCERRRCLEARARARKEKAVATAEETV